MSPLFFKRGINCSPLSYENLIAPAVYLVFPPDIFSSAFSYIVTSAPFSKEAIPAHKAAFPDPTTITFLGILIFPYN